jgi:putative transposase
MSIIDSTILINRSQVTFVAKLSSRDYEYRRSESSVSSINYHFVFVPKRRKAVLVTDVALRLQEIIFDLVTEHGWKLIALEIMPDHVHFFINAPTDEAPSQIAKWIKGKWNDLNKRLSVFGSARTVRVFGLTESLLFQSTCLEGV